ncbi:hypothetical protein DFH06DRAFT_1328562 [Mycena polygramma]|nr:hypothetical protein DFH06DRAFT_1328562 [Mycena polygramma]
MPSFKFASLAAVTFAATVAAARVTSTAVELVVGDFVSPALSCLGPGLSIPRINLVKAVLSSGQYVIVPHLPLENCGSEVFYRNNDFSSSEIFTAWAIGAAPDANLGLGPTAFAESSNGTRSFSVTYNLSPANGRNRV